jgi:hypothetical protein
MSFQQNGTTARTASGPEGPTPRRGVTRPTSALCRLRDLRRWTGWTYKEVGYYVAAGRLRTLKAKPGSRFRYYVESAQAILDGKQ